MTRISWDQTGNFFSEGIEKGVLFPGNSPGVAWSGLVSVTENADSSPTSLYIDGQKVKDHIVPTVFEGTVTAYTYPDEFEPYIGVVGGIASQVRSDFGLAYRDNRAIHLIYGAIAAPSSDQYQTLGDDVSPVLFSWSISTTPVDVPFARATSRLVISLDFADPAAVSDLEDLIYGNDSSQPSLPTPSEVIDIFESHTTLRITDLGNGNWRAEGPDDVITMLDSETFQIDWPSALYIDADSYRIFSL
jgi:hypothetical protein